MSTFDVFLLIPLAFGAFQGFRKGFMLEVLSVIALFLRFILGLKFLTTAIPVVQSYIGNAFGLLPFLSFLLVFVLIIMGVRLVGVILKKVLDFTPFGMVDNLLGGLLGGLKWCLAISLLLYVGSLAGIAISEKSVQESIIYPFVIKATPVALDVLSWMLPFIKVILTTLKGLF
ncbi:CvpA family protein [Adhaeribacter aquaticus]|uniref:CvpA family protein n=1 Tax=Adhaeribacter aquaticus TaxID=299567 RepID=UPI00047D3056|nr:CvpA family protein [Adhaeribacter aquaticus]